MRASKYLMLLLSTVILQNSVAQSDIKLSSYFMSPISYNPAYTGSYGDVAFTSIYSNQWIGFEGAPKSIFFNAHGSFIDPNVGLGLEFIHDEIGVTKNTTAMANFAYHINLSNKWRLSLGLKAGLNLYSVDYTRLYVESPSELPVLRSQINESLINIGPGFFIHNTNLYFGIGSPNIIDNNYYTQANDLLAKRAINYYLNTGYIFNYTETLTITPSLLTRVVNGAPVNTLFSVTSNYNDRFFTSINIDFKSTAGLFLGFGITEKIMAGYSYDTSINSFNRVNGGINTFFLRFILRDYWQKERCSCVTF